MTKCHIHFMQLLILKMHLKNDIRLNQKVEAKRDIRDMHKMKLE